MKRSIEISSRGTRLSLLNSRVQIIREKEVLASIPVEDLGLVILGTNGVSLSSGVLQALGEAGATVMACDDSHHPCGLFLPVAANTLHSERARQQSESSAPLKKSLWARIVKAKIRNQAALLTVPDDRRKLVGLANSVKSGDQGNVEGQAARYYWPRVYADHLGDLGVFQRHREGPPPNNLLNYGYTVLRAATARAICGAGLIPAVGLHHRNRYSGFCLADDLMEPFRPFVDRTVGALIAEGRLEVDKETKGRLIATLTENVDLGGEAFALWVALERMVSSLAQAIEAQTKYGRPAPEATRLLSLPALVESCH